MGRVLTQWCADKCIVGSLLTRDGPLCAVCMLLYVAPSFAVLPGAFMYVSYIANGIFPAGLFPAGLFPARTFPRRNFPRRIFSRRNFPRPDFFPPEFSMTGHFPVSISVSIMIKKMLI